MTQLTAPSRHAVPFADDGDRFADVNLESFRTCVDSLISTIPSSFPTLVCSANPVGLALPGWSEPQVRLAIEQYACFAQAAVHMLFETRVRTQWPHLKAELDRNIAEELGAECGGTPHLELMRRGFRTELGIDIGEVRPLPTTQSFIDDVATLFTHHEAAFRAGALLGFEATAVEEFRLVRRLILAYADAHEVVIDLDTSTGQYIAGHVALDPSRGFDPEQDHCLGVATSIGRDATDEHAVAVAQGFAAVCIELERWWLLLATEVRRAGARAGIADAIRHAARHPAS